MTAVIHVIWFSGSVLSLAPIGGFCHTTCLSTQTHCSPSVFWVSLVSRPSGVNGFSHCCDQISNKRQLKGGRADLDSMFKGTQSLPVGSHGSRSKTIWSHDIQSGSRAQSSAYLPLIMQLRTRAHGSVPPTFGVGLLTSDNLKIGDLSQARPKVCLFRDYRSCEAGNHNSRITLPTQVSDSPRFTFPAFVN